jgi:asparagine synthase (glutamine-hydrolysing)
MSNLDLDQLEQAVPSGHPRAETLPAAFTPFSHQAPTGDLLNDILRLDFATYLPGAVLAKVDRASMAHGLEVRPPLLSNSLIDFAFSLPSAVKASAWRSKIALRASASALLPKTILHRPKMGFAVPLARWLRGPLSDRLEHVMRPGLLWENGLLERSVFLAWRDQHLAMTHDHSRPLWALIVLEHWLRRVHGRESRVRASSRTHTEGSVVVA